MGSRSSIDYSDSLLVKLLLDLPLTTTFTAILAGSEPKTKSNGGNEFRGGDPIVHTRLSSTGGILLIGMGMTDEAAMTKSKDSAILITGATANIGRYARPYKVQ